MKNNELYFIPILIKAFQSENFEESIEKAIYEIEKLGEQTQYKAGLEQFKMFLNSGIVDNQTINSIDKILVGLATDSIQLAPSKKKEVLEKIESNPELRNKYKEIVDQFGYSVPIEIEVYKEGKLFANLSLVDDENELLHIEAGEYTISLNNGRVLWQGKINKEDISLDSRNQKYQMAAATEESMIKPTRKIELIKNELAVFVFAGLEFGKLRFVYQ